MHRSCWQSLHDDELSATSDFVLAFRAVRLPHGRIIGVSRHRLSFLRLAQGADQVWAIAASCRAIMEMAELRQLL